MGYYTEFDVEIFDNEIPQNVVETLSEITGYEWETDGESAWLYAKWYNHEEDMCKLSKIYPNYVFQLSGDGEDNDDIWREYWKNGKYQSAQYYILYDEFDKNRLKEWN